jgi:hypothetical protein
MVAPARLFDEVPLVHSHLSVVRPFGRVQG